MTFKGFAILMLVAAAFAGCGNQGSQSSTPTYTTESGLPSISSAKSLSAVSALGSLGIGTADFVLGTYDGSASTASLKAIVLKPGASCTWTTGETSSEVVCTIWDGLGNADSEDHKCDVTGIGNPNSPSFDLFYDCYNFQISENASIDGNFSLTANIDPNYANFGKQADVPLNKGLKSSGTCETEDDSNSFVSGYDDYALNCTWEESYTTICSEDERLYNIEYLTGARSLKITDECGTYEMTPGTTLRIDGCKSDSGSYDSSSNLFGKFNGELVDIYFNVSCTGE